MKLKIVSLVGIFLCNISSYAALRTVDSISVKTGMSKWKQSIFDTAAGRDVSYVECAETSEISGAYICGYFDQIQMNLALLRASLFAEGNFGNPKGAVAKQTDPRFRSNLSSAAGEDLTSADLIKFYNSAENQCLVDSSYCLNDQEKEVFTKFILPTYERKKDFVVITFAARSTMGLEGVVTHEIMHAYYFLIPKYKAVIDGFWQEVIPEDEKARIRLVLSHTYDIENETLIKNEFQSYLLMMGAEYSLLFEFVPRYRDALMEMLRKNGFEPVQISSESEFEN